MPRETIHSVLRLLQFTLEPEEKLPRGGSFSTTSPSSSTHTASGSPLSTRPIWFRTSTNWASFGFETGIRHDFARGRNTHGEGRGNVIHLRTKDSRALRRRRKVWVQPTRDATAYVLAHHGWAPYSLADAAVHGREIFYLIVELLLFPVRFFYFTCS
jgi:hypothetical protein